MPIKSYSPWLGAKFGWRIIGSGRPWSLRILDRAGSTAKAHIMCIAGLALYHLRTMRHVVLLTPSNQGRHLLSGT